MQVVVDANIIISLLIRGRFTKKLFYNKRLELVCPNFLFSEILKYKDVIIKKVKITESELIESLQIIKKRVEAISSEEYKEFIELANEISPGLRNANN